ncbi:MAG: hypothetical protein CVU68_02220 [Deltaproteobacteria bacterium HGW-Deltaproteobacteria-3]|nr:MAG: hypothetical protein CVU68_02220 [Deltaproteobacteria bacterium HGW-Deltaproteobacteria-3]
MFFITFLSDKVVRALSVGVGVWLFFSFEFKWFCFFLDLFFELAHNLISKEYECLCARYDPRGYGF